MTLLRSIPITSQEFDLGSAGCPSWVPSATYTSLWGSCKGESGQIHLWRKNLAPYTGWCSKPACWCTEREGTTGSLGCKRPKIPQPKNLTKMQCSGALYGIAGLADLVMVSYSLMRQSLPAPAPWEAGVTGVPCVTLGEPGHWQHHPCAGTESGTAALLPLLAKGQEIQSREQWKPVSCHPSWMKSIFRLGNYSVCAFLSIPTQEAEISSLSSLATERFKKMLSWNQGLSRLKLLEPHFS